MSRWLVLFLMLSSCSVSPIKRSDATDQKIERVNLALVRFFNPEYEPARIDEFEQTNRELRCEAPRSWWKARVPTEKIPAILECVNSIRHGVASYLYESTGKIFLKLDPHESDQPPCLKKALPEIPLPREVYFFGVRDHETGQGAYAASFNMNTNQVLDAELRQARVGVEVRFPLSRELKDENDVQLWLTTLAFLLLKSDGDLMASIVTDRVSDRCFHDEPHFFDKKRGKLPPVFWP